ncbi:hypothetical protein OV079_37775 [Nannocystis pusilla]|uniref:Uncharacterized protein n=1 Tax=Nannocystis pusilla TaxID=889268 RepID=A0A9X3EVV0_9BACT|nr:hypothetical protein [Nannocystis pusilla]MCY1011213.1 hypothetical protein [Nannocystis pusilla]
MDRPPAALVLAAALALAACSDNGDGPTTIVTGATTDITSPATGTTEGSTSSSSGGSDAGTGSTTSTATTEAGSSSTSTSSSTSNSTTTTTGDETTTTGDASSTTMLDPVEACLAEVDPGDECNECICTECLMQWDACHADEGCTAIQQCAQTNGCYGDECDAPCATVMNFYGPPDSPSMTAWKALTACLVEASCDRKCPW